MKALLYKLGYPIINAIGLSFDLRRRGAVSWNIPSWSRVSVCRNCNPTQFFFSTLESYFEMKSVNKKAFVGLLFLLIVMWTFLFLPAWSLVYWQAWAFLAVFGASALAISLYLMKSDPSLLERRVQAGPIAEKEKSQKIIQSITSIAFISIMVISALDHRFSWSTVSLRLAVTGDLLVALGFLIIFFVYRENSFASATIEVFPGQKVISTGLYADVYGST